MKPLVRNSHPNNSLTPRNAMLQLRQVLRRHPWVGIAASFVSGGFLAPAILAAIEGIVSPLWVVVGTVAIIVLLISLASVYESIRTTAEPQPIEQLSEFQVTPAYKGLVLLVSTYDIARKAIEYHQGPLERCWLITSAAPAVEALAERIQKEFDPLPMEIRKIRNQFESEGTRNAVASIYESGLQDWGLAPTDVITDVTGGTKAMTLGAFVACQQGNYPVQYMPSIFDANTNERRGIGKPIRVELQR